MTCGLEKLEAAPPIILALSSDNFNGGIETSCCSYLRNRMKITSYQPEILLIETPLQPHNSINHLSTTYQPHNSIIFYHPEWQRKPPINRTTLSFFYHPRVAAEITYQPHNSIICLSPRVAVETTCQPHTSFQSNGECRYN